MTRLALVGFAAFLVSSPLPAQTTTSKRSLMPDPARLKTVEQILGEVPLIDGHNDLPWQIREEGHGDLGRIDLSRNNREILPEVVSDIPRFAPGTWADSSGRFTFPPSGTSPKRSWPCWNRSIWFIA